MHMNLYEWKIVNEKQNPKKGKKLLTQQFHETEKKRREDNNNKNNKKICEQEIWKVKT